MTEYILYVAQLQNFQPRTMLIPAKEYLKFNKATYDQLKAHSKHLEGIDNLMVKNYIPSPHLDGAWTSESTPYGQIINDLTMYAENLGYEYDDDDKNGYMKIQMKIVIHILLVMLLTKVI